LTITTWALFRKLIIDSSLQALVSGSGKSLWLLPGSVIATGTLCKVVHTATPTLNIPSLFLRLDASTQSAFRPFAKGWVFTSTVWSFVLGGFSPRPAHINFVIYRARLYFMTGQFLIVLLLLGPLKFSFLLALMS